MPTIDGLNPAAASSGGDAIPLTQTDGITRKAALGANLSIDSDGNLNAAGSGEVPTASLLGGASNTYVEVGLDADTLQISGGNLTPKTNTANGLVQSDASDNITLGNLLVETTNESVAAAGTNQATATALSGRRNFVSTVPSGSGVSLPADTPKGAAVWVYNTAATGVGVTVYPATSSGTINNGTAGVGVLLYGKNEFFSFGNDNWATTQ